MPEMHKVYRKVFNETKNTWSKKYYKVRDDSLHIICKSNYCNPKCVDYYKDDVQGRTDFEKRLKNDFLDTYSKKEVEMFQKKGAVSGCYDDSPYDGSSPGLHYNLFHK